LVLLLRELVVLQLALISAVRVLQSVLNLAAFDGGPACIEGKGGRGLYDTHQISDMRMVLH
jgi:hypothetical protein